MTRWAARLPRIVAAAALGLVQCSPPPVYAVSPPAIDDARLPTPVPPAPAQPTVQREVCTVPAFDPQRLQRPRQLDSLDLPAIWGLTRGRGQRVAVIDTGVSPHRRLPRLIAGGDYVSGGDGTQDCDGHGTVVAGIIAATADPAGSDGFSGIAPEATVIAIRQASTKFGRVGDSSNTGIGDVDTMAKAVRTAADLGVSVINISTVACVPAGSMLDDRALGAALAYAVNVKDAVVVAAAGNSDGACPRQSAETTWDTSAVAVSPAWYDEFVLTVGSVTADGAPSAFTLPGPWVDVAAPGEAVLSLSPVGDALANAVGDRAAQAITGTSYAAPVVSGLAALIRSRFPALSARQVTGRIESTAHHPPDGWNPVVGNGVIDVAAAVDSGAPAAAATAQHDPAVTPAPAPDPVDRRPPQTAITGAALCAAVLVLALAGARFRRPAGGPIHHIAGE